MANTKLTKKDYFKMAIAETSNAELIAFFNHEIELLERKNSSSGSKAPSKNQVANESLKSEILDLMANDTRYTVSELDKLMGIGSPNKTNALVKQLKDSGLVVRTVEKGRAYFTKAQEDLKKSSQKPLDKIVKMV